MDFTIRPLALADRTKMPGGAVALVTAPGEFDVVQIIAHHEAVQIKIDGPDQVAVKERLALAVLRELPGVGAAWLAETGAVAVPAQDLTAPQEGSLDKDPTVLAQRFDNALTRLRNAHAERSADVLDKIATFLESAADGLERRGVPVNPDERLREQRMAD